MCVQSDLQFAITSEQFSLHSSLLIACIEVNLRETYHFYLTFTPTTDSQINPAMSTVPCTSFAAPRVHNALNHQHRPKISCEKGDIDPCSALIASGQSATHERPTIATYFIKNDQMFTQSTRTNPDGSTSVFALPVDNLTNMCSPGVLIRSDKFDPTTMKQADLKPVPSSSSPGVGPRKG